MKLRKAITLMSKKRSKLIAFITENSNEKSEKRTFWADIFHSKIHQKIDANQIVSIIWWKWKLINILTKIFFVSDISRQISSCRSLDDVIAFWGRSFVIRKRNAQLRSLRNRSNHFIGTWNKKKMFYYVIRQPRKKWK